MYKFAVFGNPIEHSCSPYIHQNFAQQFGIKISYQKFFVNNFISSAQKFIKDGANGFNITTPFKNNAYNFVNQLSDLAIKAKAVNTIKIVGGKIIGYNTDGIGLAKDLIDNIGINLTDKIILILGAGGAARGIIPALLQHKPKRLMVANRTAIKALELADEFKYLGNTCGIALEKVKNNPVDILINATSASLDKQVPKIAKGCVSNAICYDLMYGKNTAFIQFVKKNNAKVAFNGWGMLVEQAASSFEIWLGRRPDTSFLLNNPL